MIVAQGFSPAFERSPKGLRYFYGRVGCHAGVPSSHWLSVS
jgi:hypothetical protein